MEVKIYQQLCENNEIDDNMRMNNLQHRETY